MASPSGSPSQTPACTRICLRTLRCLIGRALPTARSTYLAASPLLLPALGGTGFSTGSPSPTLSPRLRPRLTLGGLPFPRKPQASGGKVSHLTLVTHAGILSTVQSSLAYALPSTRTVRSPTPNRSQMSEVRCRILSTSLSSCIFASLKLCILLLVRYAMSYLYILSHNLSLVILLFHCLIQALSLNTS